MDTTSTIQKAKQVAKCLGETLAPSKLKINNRLPKIILPMNKLQTFAEWWNNDIRYETTVPHAFEEGYFILDNKDVIDHDVSYYAPLIKLLAKNYRKTYREVENALKEFFINMEELTVYFKFTKDDEIKTTCYDRQGSLITDGLLNIGVGCSQYDLSMSDLKIEEATDINDLVNVFMYKTMFYLVTCLWYIATTSSNKKYIYEEVHPVVVSRHKKVVQVSDTKYIRTPVYDLSKAKTIKVDRLISRKKGWTYSHAFQVHGHYRHYKTGKTVFINSYIKGKEKPFKAQQLVLEPRQIKEE